jgi:hypothetical protein
LGAEQRAEADNAIKIDVLAFIERKEAQRAT